MYSGAVYEDQENIQCFLSGKAGHDACNLAKLRARNLCLQSCQDRRLHLQPRCQNPTGNAEGRNSNFRKTGQAQGSKTDEERSGCCKKHLQY